MAEGDSLSGGHRVDCLDDLAHEVQDLGMVPQGPGAHHQITQQNSCGFSVGWVTVITRSGKEIAFPLTLSPRGD